MLARVPFHAKLVRPGGTLSGPTIMALGDAAMYAVVLGRLGRVEMAVTSNLNINFLVRPKPVSYTHLDVYKRQVLVYAVAHKVAHQTHERQVDRFAQRLAQGGVAVVVLAAEVTKGV